MIERASSSGWESNLDLDLIRSATRGIEFLRRCQLPHGEFTTLLGANRKLSNPVFDSSPFTTSFIVYALTEFKDIAVEDILNKAADFLASEMEFGGVWRYWSTRQHKHARLPPDTDDTACISYALKRASRPVPRNTWILLHSRDRCGRFLTWMRPLRQGLLNPRLFLTRSLGYGQASLRARRNALPPFEDPRFQVMHIDRGDVDPVVNANAVLYVGERRETLRAIQFVIDSVARGTSNFSRFYEDPLALYYATARAFRHSAPTLTAVREPIVSRVIARCAEQSSLNTLEAAMAASVLLTFEPRADVLPRLTGSLLEAQRDDGGWDAFPFYNVWGSRELTTGFCLEVLARQSQMRHV